MQLAYNSVLQPSVHYLNFVHSVQWEYMFYLQNRHLHTSYTLQYNRNRQDCCVYGVCICWFCKQNIKPYVRLQFRAV